jgi:hypothetical protein
MQYRWNKLADKGYCAQCICEQLDLNPLDNA